MSKPDPRSKPDREPEPDTAEPPEPRFWQRWLRSLRNFILYTTSFAIIAAGAAWYGWMWLNAEIDKPGPNPAAKIVLIPRGAGLRDTSVRLDEAGLLKDPRLFFAAHLLRSHGKTIRAGEFEFPAAISVSGILEILQSGHPVQRRLTVPEGLTTQNMLALIQQADGLFGPLPRDIPEGALLPDTYFYAYGESRADVIHRMRRAMDEVLAATWAGRRPDLPLSGPRELLSLAAMIEKETGIEAERPRIAAVFINRLRKGMKLQSDPTVIYSIAGGAGKLDRTLTKTDLERVHAYNTYAVNGLPPGPIAAPGRAALNAAAHPATSEDLYFVADGSGGHAFAKSLDEHNRNVTRWRQVQRERGLRD